MIIEHIQLSLSLLLFSLGARDITCLSLLRLILHLRKWADVEGHENEFCSKQQDVNFEIR